MFTHETHGISTVIKFPNGEKRYAGKHGCRHPGLICEILERASHLSAHEIKWACGLLSDLAWMEAGSTCDASDVISLDSAGLLAQLAELRDSSDCSVCSGCSDCSCCSGCSRCSVCSPPDYSQVASVSVLLDGRHNGTIFPVGMVRSVEAVLKERCQTLLREVGKEMRAQDQFRTVPNHRLIQAMVEVEELSR